MIMPTIPVTYFSDFVRGYFDGDGCVSLERSKGSKGQAIIRRLTVVFTSGSKQFLKVLARQLAEHTGIQRVPVWLSNCSFQLRYSTTDSTKLFCLFYKQVRPGLYLRRKFDIFAQYFQLRPSRVTDGIARILDVFQHGHVVK